jgi:hypothetical protein
MFQLSFEMPRSFSIDEADLKRFRRVHFVDVSVEEKLSSSNRCVVVLRTFEFCSNKAYAIHASILGKETGVRNSGYEFMEDVVNALAVSLFNECKIIFLF